MYIIKYTYICITRHYGNSYYDIYCLIGLILWVKRIALKGVFLDSSDEMPAPIPFWIVFSTAKYSIHMHPI